MDWEGEGGAGEEGGVEAGRNRKETGVRESVLLVQVFNKVSDSLTCDI